MSATISPPTQELSKLEPPPTSHLLQNDFFNLKDLFTLDDLIESRVHLGHKDGMLDPHMRPYIFGKRLGVLIFDLERTQKLLNQALLVTAEIAYRKGIILFLNQSRQTGHLAEAAAKECGEYAYCRRWSNKVLSDSQQTFGSVTRLPDLIILLSVLEKVNELHAAVPMSAKMLIPTVGVCDTNADPTLITYPVPGNDDTPHSIELYCKLFKQAILNGKRKRDEIIDMYGLEYYDKTLQV
jgi:small subunit ribosomal protein S2